MTDTDLVAPLIITDTVGAPAAGAPPPTVASVPMVAIEREVRNRLGRALRDGFVSPYDHLDEAVVRAQALLATVLPLSLLRRIQDFRYDPGASGSLLLTGLPVDDELPPTPTSGHRCREKRTFVSEGIVLGFARLLGEPYGFEDEKDGETIHNICPVEQRQSARSNEGSALDFFLHTEVAFHHFRPDFLLLFCLRADPRQAARTFVEDLAEVVDDLEIDEIDLLRQPRFVLEAPESFVGYTRRFGDADGELRPAPVILDYGIERGLCLNFNAMKALDDGAARALEHLRQLLYRPGRLKEVTLASGDLLVLHNRKAVHGRSPFLAHFDGTDRWLQRVYVREDLWRNPDGPAYPRRTVASHRRTPPAALGAEA